MPNMTQDEARARIVDIIGDSVYQALGMKEALQDERKALEAQDMDALNVIVDSKTRCVEELQRLDRERVALCEQWGFEDGPHQMTAVIEWCDEDQLISSRWEQLMVIAAEGSALNMTNGAIIRLRQQQIDANLSVLRGATPGSDTYNRSGGDSSDHQSRSLAQA
jgi:flagella synthesis protein FlgN